MLNSRPVLKDILAFMAKASFVALMLVISIVIGVELISRAAEDVDRQRTFSVDGMASRYVKPDTANLSVSTKVTDASAREVQKEASEIITDTVDALKDLGLEDKEIRTGDYQINPEYKYDDDTNERSIYAYSINVSLVIKTKKIDKVSDILDAATSAGINQVNSFYFSIEDIEDIQEELKLDAIDNAKEKAEEQAKVAGLKLGKVLNVYDQYYTPSYSRALYEDDMKMLAAPVAEAVDEDEVSIPIIGGEEEIEVTVTVEYLVR